MIQVADPRSERSVYVNGGYSFAEFSGSSLLNNVTGGNSKIPSARLARNRGRKLSGKVRKMDF